MAAHEQPTPWAPEANKMNDWGTCLHKSKMENLFPKGSGSFFLIKRAARKGSSGGVAAHTHFLVSLCGVLISSPWQESNTSWFAPAITGWPRSVSFSTCGEVLHTRRTLVQKQMTFCVISLQRTGLLYGLIHILQSLVILSVYVGLLADGKSKNGNNSTQLNSYAEGVFMPDIQWMWSVIFESSLKLNYSICLFTSLKSPIMNWKCIFA